ncbi:hypothetical protein Y032_0091g2506 [Ancylostoma ceylanicum]|uniref:Uncharacterized protein n=1 Tax=Ancylostoma ceylanicum TaxID=53326 RepID=A0A016TN43_9BILA|nr:hypothetical protein Y032_0091g2506 [Ancylostoma ceylanicum]
MDVLILRQILQAGSNDSNDPMQPAPFKLDIGAKNYGYSTNPVMTKMHQNAFKDFFHWETERSHGFDVI